MRQAIQNMARGLGMGAADVVPGVSGGTVALILGIYPKLIESISRFDREFIRLLIGRRFRQAFDHVNGWFLTALLTGILAGIAVTALTIHRLLEHPQTRPSTLAAFFGMITGSGFIVAQMIPAKSLGERLFQIVLGLIGLAFAAWITTLEPSDTVGDTPQLWYVFVCAAIAICAMILPGISGAMILLLLGLYPHLTAIPDDLIAGKNIGENLIVLTVFAIGCGCGLLSFSRLLKYFLSRQFGATMSLLVGLMFGSLPNLWPFQRDTTPDISDFEDKHFRPMWPESFGVDECIAIGVAVIATVAVLAVHVLISKHKQEVANKT